MAAAVGSPELDGPPDAIVKDGQTLTRTPSVSRDAIANVTGGCPPAVLHWRPSASVSSTGVLVTHMGHQLMGCVPYWCTWVEYKMARTAHHGDMKESF